MCLLGGLGACSLRKILNLDPLRLLLSGTRLLFNTCDKTILNFKIFFGGGGGGGDSRPLPPLCMKSCKVFCFPLNQSEGDSV